jgi:hypothetical protein
MNKIILSENCFGNDVEVDGESLFTHEFDNRSPEMIGDLKDGIIDKLKSLKHKLSVQDWSDIAHMIITNSDEFEYDVENSKDYQPCDQCGNWNHNHIYIRKEYDGKS